MSIILSEHFRNKLNGFNGYRKGGDNGAGAQADAMNKSTELQRQQWQQVMNNLAPFTPLAQQYVGQLQNLSTLDGQQSALNDYYNSGQYKQLADQASYLQNASAEATGQLGASSNQNALAAIAPQLGQSWLSGQMNNAQNLANIGLGALTGQANAGQTYANNMSQLYGQQAQTAAANANRPTGWQSALSGAAYGAIAGGKIGGPWGAGIGAGIGALGSLF